MESSRQPDESVGAAAAKWLARRDRGLSPAEQDAYLQWLRESPAHGAEIVGLERAWHRLDKLQHWHPAHSCQPNPDLLAPSRRHGWLWPSISVAAAAAAVALALLPWRSSPPASAGQHRTIVHPGPRRLALADGSLVELNAEAKIDVRLTPERRNVRLLQGEAHFIVAKDAGRPFVVTADNFTVRAVGTAFDVNLASSKISVLVTEGNVQIGKLRSSGDPALLSRLGAGELGTVNISPSASPAAIVQVRDLTPAEVEAALAWQSLRLEFVELPLREVVAEFNRYNSRKLVVADKATGAILVGGTFRADNVEAFVRLLDVGFGVGAESRGDDLLLTCRR